MYKLIFHHIFATCVLFTRGSNITLLKEVTILLMSDEDPHSDIEFTVVY